MRRGVPLLVIPLVLAACSSTPAVDTDDPVEVAVAWGNALLDENYGRACELATWSDDEDMNCEEGMAAIREDWVGSGKAPTDLTARTDDPGDGWDLALTYTRSGGDVVEQGLDLDGGLVDGYAMWRYAAWN